MPMGSKNSEDNYTYSFLLFEEMNSGCLLMRVSKYGRKLLLKLEAIIGPYK
jgi:hypothetical protein